MPLDLRDLFESAETVSKWRLEWVLSMTIPIRCHRGPMAAMAPALGSGFRGDGGAAAKAVTSLSNVVGSADTAAWPPVVGSLRSPTFSFLLGIVGLAITG